MRADDGVRTRTSRRATALARPKIAVAVAVVMVAAVAAPAASASPPPRLLRLMVWFQWHPSARAPQDHGFAVGSRVLIGLAASRDLGGLRRQYHFAVLRVFPALHAAEIRVTRSLLAAARSDARLRYLSPLGAPQRLLSIPTAPLLATIDPTTGLPYEWQFGAADVAAALALSAGSAAVVVGTIDSGTAAIPDLVGKVDSRWAVSPSGRVTRDDRGDDYVGHGTAVASLIAANGFGMAGFGGATHVISVRARQLTDVAVAVALMKLDSLGVRIVNMSFGGPAPERPIVLDAIHRAQADGMLLIAAAGNSAGPVSHPAADLQPPNGQESEGLAVGASDVGGQIAFFSSRGADLSLLAPGIYRGPCSGVLVAAPLNDDFVDSCYPSWSLQDGGSYAYVAGTSFAAAEVAGIAALIWAIRPSLKNFQVADIIKESARRTGAGWTPGTGCGTLDAGAAVTLASQTPAEWGTPSRSPAVTCSAAG